MVEVRASRLNVETVAGEGTVGEITRMDVQTAAQLAGASQVQVSRLGLEVVAREPPTAGVTRMDVQTAAQFAGAVPVQVSRLAVEVVGAEQFQPGVTRMDVQTAARVVGSAPVQVSRMALECVARQGSSGAVFPLAVADDSHIFLHNWVSRSELTSSFRTAIEYSPDLTSGAESRRGLVLKPLRTMELEWQICPTTSLSQLERLAVVLRRMTNQRFQVPIYSDQKELLATAGSADTVLSVDTTKARFFIGQRIAIVRVDPFNARVSSFVYRTIVDLTATTITISSSLGATTVAGTIVFPIMDCEVMLEAEVDYITARVPVARLTVVEAPGASQLPALKADTPVGASVFDSRPIWYEEPDWSEGIVKGRSRQGFRSSGGRADTVTAEGPRSRQTHRYTVAGKRDRIWNALEFFETRRGALRSFWHIDQDQYLTPQAIDASGNFVSVSVIGNLADITEEFQYLGLVMKDGTTYVRRVSTVQEVLTVFRFTLTTPLPMGLSASNVARVARARTTRFTTDAFTESWLSRGWMSAGVDFLEVLNEDNYSTT